MLVTSSQGGDTGMSLSQPGLGSKPDPTPAMAVVALRETGAGVSARGFFASNWSPRWDCEQE